MISLLGKECDYVKHEKIARKQLLFIIQEKQVLSYSKQCLHPC